MLKQLAVFLANKHWRLDNLYTIVDKEDNVGILKMNYAQTVLFKVKHPKTITLKSRQQGISTYKVAEGLDRCIFEANSQNGIQSYGLSESKKLYAKALFMWEHFDPTIKKSLGIKLVVANSEGFKFNNGSTLKIGNFRGDTLSSLHVSELAKIAKKFPEKAEELNTGAFEAVSTNSSISIESTAEGKGGLFYEMWQRAELRLKLVGEEGLTPLDFYPIFLSWTDDPDCSMAEYYEATKEDRLYFTKVEKDLDIVLTQEQKNWAAAKRSRLGGKFDQEYPYSPKAAFDVPVEGTYYLNEYKTLNIQEQELYDPNLLVHSAMDLGMNDTFSIGFFQQHPDGTVKIIGEYHNNGQGLAFYRDIYKALSKERGWVFGVTYVPHDVAVKELIAAQTRWDAMVEMGFNPVLVQKHRLLDGIEATRRFLKTVVISNKCEAIVGAIQNYRKKFDRSLSVYLDSPLHDEYSHTADMIRYIAMGLLSSPISDIYVRETKQVKRKSLGYDI